MELGAFAPFLQSPLPDSPPTASQEIGGCDVQKQEIREAVELPLTHHELYRQIGIDPPRGVLLYGPPGTGKTMLAKAVAHHTTAAFIRVVGSEFVQKYLGEVRDAPCAAPSLLMNPQLPAWWLKMPLRVHDVLNPAFWSICCAASHLHHKSLGRSRPGCVACWWLAGMVWWVSCYSMIRR